MKKIMLAVFGALLISAMAFAAAGRDNAPTSSVAALPPGFNATGLPIVSQPLSVDIFQVRYRSHGAEYMTNSFFTQLEKDTNIKVNWETRYSTDFREQKAMMLASGSLPEVIFGLTGFEDNDILQNTEYFLPLEDLIDQYMPNLKAIMAEDPVVRRVITYPDGHIYSLPTRSAGLTLTLNGEAVTVAGQPFINKTWLDKLGLQVPQTTDELYQVLKAFKERDPNGNGIADEIPWIMMAPTGGFNAEAISFFGILGDFMVDNGKVYYAFNTPQFRQGIEWMAKLYAEGIIDSEYFTMNSDMYYSKAADTTIQRFGFIIDWVSDAALQGNAKDFVVMPPPAGPDGKRYSITADGAGVSRTSLMITTKCKYPAVIARWADQFYTPDATVQNSWGAFGECTQKEADGSYTILPLSATPGFESQDFRMWNRAPKIGPMYISPSFTKYNMDKTSGDGLKAEIAKIGLPYTKLSAIFPGMAFRTADQARELSLFETDFNSYVISTTADWIAKGGVTDAEWNTYLRQLDTMNLARFIAIKQAIYDTYMRK
jgi:putative aldouronate transport system substrate-binding protein